MNEAPENQSLAEQEFERWRKITEPRLKKESFVTAWSKEAWLAEGRTFVMGRNLDKLQQRIGRQRKANRRQHLALKVAHERIEHLEAALEQIAGAYKNMSIVEKLVGRPSVGRLASIADISLSDLKKEANND